MAGTPPRRAVLRAGLLMALVGVLLGSGVAPGATPPASPSTAPLHPAVANGTAWAYGGTREASGTQRVGNVELGFTDDSNYAVVLNETDANATYRTVALTRVLGTSGFFAACWPDCGNPTESIRGISSGAEFETAELVLERTGNVSVAGTEVPAVALVSESLTLAGHLNVSFSWQNLTDPQHPLVEWFNATTVANTTGRFAATGPAGALGLVPSDLANASGWTGRGLYSANASTAYEGNLSYQGNMFLANRSEFSGTSSPISPMSARLNGTELPAAHVPGDRGLALVPGDVGTNLLEGTLLVPTSAYFYAAFSSSCDLAQRPCLADAKTPELDVNASSTARLGWDAAVSSISAFACWFDATALYDTPNGGAFWAPGAGVVAPARPGTANGSSPPTVTGLPMSVEQAWAIQDAWHPLPGFENSTRGNGSTGPTNGTGPGGSNQTPPNGSGSPAVPRNVAGGRASAGFPRWAIVPAAGGAGAAVALVALVATRRRRPPRGTNASEESPAAEPAEGAPSGDDQPMGYAW